MANNKLLVDERQSDLGNFIVGRLLPFRKKRQVGPFTFIDHMGPAVLGPEKYMDVDQHPHIGLSTLTYLMEGQIEHKDSVGSQQIISAGDVGFMTAGRAVTHTERTPQSLRKGPPTRLHGYQIWIALPTELEDCEPQFDYFEKESLPHWQEEGLELRLIAGDGFGRSSPLRGYSPLFMIDVVAHENKSLDLRHQLEGELAFVIVNGSISSSGQTVNAGQMLISKTDQECEISMIKGSRILLFGGQPLPEERYLLWNFVSHSKEKLQDARQRWIDRKFPKVPEDETYIPFPPSKN